MSNGKNQQNQENAALLERLAALEAENERLKAENNNPIRLNRSRYGALQLHGIRRMPISYYSCEWRTILEAADRIQEKLRELDPASVGVDDGILDKATSYELWPSDGNGKREEPKKVAK
jgi:hypothetical protein